MKNLFKNKNSEIDFSSLGTILSTSVAAGVAFTNYSGKNPKNAGIICVGLSLLVTGLITVIDEDPVDKYTN